MPCWCSAPPGVIVPAVHRWRVNPVLAFLVAGAVLGPLGLGSFKDIWPSLQWVTITDAKNVAGIAELGVVFLLFLIGLELSYERLLTMRRLVFGLGSLQVVLSATAISIVAALLGSKAAAAVIIGLCLALSSTAIVIELLSEQRRLMSATGRASFAVLLLQDLAVVPMLLLVSILGADNGPLDRHRRHDRAGAGGAGRRPDRGDRAAAAAPVLPPGRRHRDAASCSSPPPCS